MSVLFAFLLFSFLIFIHELGHFVAAKLSGVQVNEFSLFLGPAIYQKQIGETLYSIRAIPLGGFCAMEGEEEESDNPRCFRKATFWKRLMIMVAGAAMNFLAGVLLLALAYAPAQQFAAPVIDFFEEGCVLNSPEGLQPGDRILSVDGERVYLAADFTMLLRLNPGDIHDLTVERNGQKVVLDDFNLVKGQFPDGKGGTSLRYGFSFALEEATFRNKASYVFNTALNAVRTVRLSFRMLFTGQAGFADLGGPVMIVDQMAQVADASSTALDAALNLFYLGAFIAINLAVMNLLPIPALDGGRVLGLVVTAVIERIIGKELDSKYEAYVHAAGMILLLGLMAAIMFKDIFMIFKR